MKTEIKPGIKGRQEKIVGEKDLASFYGSGHVNVFATPAMIALIEQTADLSIKSYLPENLVSVGFEVNIRHLKATMPGKKVWAETELIETDGKKFIFKVAAYDEEGCIGKGQHTRYAVDKNIFEK